MEIKSFQRVFNYAFWIAAILLMATLALPRIRETRAQPAAQPAFVPYTATLEQSFTQPNGASAVGLTITWALRSDGSMASRVISKAGAPLVQRMVSFANGQRIEILESAGKKSTTFDPSQPLFPTRDPHASCLAARSSAETQAGEEMIDGYRAAKIVRQNITAWHALDYGCALLRERADWGSKGFNETRLVKLTPGEPAADLFADPQDYTEVPPSGLVRGRPASDDAYYLSHRPR